MKNTTYDSKYIGKFENIISLEAYFNKKFKEKFVIEIINNFAIIKKFNYFELHKIL